MLEPVLVVLAAGIGSRYGGLKQIDPVGPSGELIIDYSVYDALRAGFERVAFVISREIRDVFCQRVGRTIEQQCPTIYVFQDLTDVPEGFQVPPGRQKPWGTAHATLACRQVINAPFAVINADDFYGRSAFEALYDFLHNDQAQKGIRDYCMVGFPLENTLTEHGHVSRGICSVDQRGFLDQIQERKRVRSFGQTICYSEDGETWTAIPEGSIASMNIWGFTPSLFSDLEARFSRFLAENAANIETAEFYLPNAVGDMIREKNARVRVLPTADRWFGVTYQLDKPKLKEALGDLIGKGIYPENLWKR